MSEEPEPGYERLPHRTTVIGECFYCENTDAQFVLLPREGKALRLRCEGCGHVLEVER